uniref:Red chlorophyll catabolite reductase n=1 Tax=Chrysotila carterae TaxID=13221 RepID=A0A7S4AY09_CHRCT
MAAKVPAFESKENCLTGQSSGRSALARSRGGCILCSLKEDAEKLFDTYTAEAPARQSELYMQAWEIVREALALAAPHATSDLSAFNGALAAFVTPGPSDLSAVPEERRPMMTKLSDTAASYERLVEPNLLSWGTRYRTLNRPLGAFFCGISLWPRCTVDVPNLTLYFGSGSAVNPDRVFMRLEMVPRVDTDTDAGYARRYYELFNARYFEFVKDEQFEPYVSESAYARGAQAPSGLRYFFDGTERNMAIARAAVVEYATTWAEFNQMASPLSADESEAISVRDALIRRVAADESPDNANRELVFGKETFKRTKAVLAGDESVRL